MVKIAIVDDELQYVIQLKEFLKRYEVESGNKMFITNMIQFAIKGYTVDALDYIEWVNYPSQ